MFGKVDHIGIAVKDIEKAIFFFQDIFGGKLLRKNIVVEQKLISGIISMGSVNFELMQSTAENSTIDKFISKNGEGIHHISFQVEDLDTFLTESSAKDIKILGKNTTNDYKVAFIHPQSALGVLIEVIERVK
jgi:methylmalonyl-CoA/ethylmalonyl-CoA epimerase